MARQLRSLTVPSFRDTEIHLVQRACRRTFIFAPQDGDSPAARKIKANRRKQMTEALKRMSAIFPMTIYEYAFLGNHFHICMKWQPTKAMQWSAAEVAARWWQLYPDNKMDKDSWIAAQAADLDWVEATRNKLMQIGFFNKAWKQPLAQQWNKEDNVTGPVFNRHYSAYPIHGETHRMAVMAYIALNEFAAGICKWPEACRNSSLSVRVAQAPAVLEEAKKHWFANIKTVLPSYGYEGYLSFIDRFSRKQRKHKKYVAQDAPSIFERIRQMKSFTEQLKRKINQNLNQQIEKAITEASELIDKLRRKYIDNESVRLNVGMADWARQMAAAKQALERSPAEPPG